MLILPFVSTAEVWPKEAMNIWGVGVGGRGRMDKDKDMGAFLYSDMVIFVVLTLCTI